MLPRFELKQYNPILIDRHRASKNCKIRLPESKRKHTRKDSGSTYLLRGVGIEIIK